MRPIEIVGGGLSGLSLGIFLSRKGVPIRLYETQAYPRHRVCGEFVSGMTPAMIETFGLNSVFRQALVHESTSWFDSRHRCFFQFELPSPAYGISRFLMDRLLSEELAQSGGKVIFERREASAHEGQVWTTGRGKLKSGKSKWIGLKAHFMGLNMEDDLEMHAGRGGYVGLSKVEDGVVNVCGLFPASAGKGLPMSSRFEGAHHDIGLNQLGYRLKGLSTVEGSRCGTAHFQAGRQIQQPNVLTLGDACHQIPPFTGHGMTMAIQSAFTAHDSLLQYSAGHVSWQETVRKAREKVLALQSSRVRWASLLHPVMTSGLFDYVRGIFGPLASPVIHPATRTLWGQS